MVIKDYFFAMFTGLLVSASYDLLRSTYNKTIKKKKKSDVSENTIG
jgi:hypothetical protein